MRVFYAALAALAALPATLGTPVLTTDPSVPAPTATIKPESAYGQAITVTGQTDGKLDTFLGIPFGEPPVGALRFAPPKPKVYCGDIVANKGPPACLQDKGGLLGDYGISEDCLYLNIIGPRKVAGTDANLPVMVWIYGGGFTSGAGSMYVSPYFAQYAVDTDRPFLLVTINYRLGIFGWGNGAEFAANGGANLGLRDQILALQWVKENIKAFGGDPTKVTAFGQSAGAISVANLMLNETTDLFQGAIMMSGAQSTAPLGPTGEWWQAPYNSVVHNAGCGNLSTSATTPATPNQASFDCLKALPADQLLAAQIKTKNTVTYAIPFIWGPSVDGDLIPDAPWKLLKDGKFARIPFISGNAKDEGTGFIPTFISSDLLPLKTVVNMLYPSPLSPAVIDEVEAKYPNVPALGAPYGTGNDTFGFDPLWKQLASVIGDAAFQSRRRWFLRQANEHDFTETWSYNWDGTLPGQPVYMGAAHGNDVQYSFGNVSVVGGYTPDEVALSQAMMNYWINFAYYRNPNGENIKKPSGCGPEQTLNTTYWPSHHYPSDKNALFMSSTNVSAIQDDYREDQMSVYFLPNISEALHFKRNAD